MTILRTRITMIEDFMENTDYFSMANLSAKKDIISVMGAITIVSIMLSEKKFPNVLKVRYIKIIQTPK